MSVIVRGSAPPVGGPAGFTVRPAPARPRPRGADAVRPDVRPHVPLALVVASLCWLAALAIYFPPDIYGDLRQLASTVEPATRAAADLQLALSSEAANTRAFLLTDNPEYAGAFQAARATRRAAQDHLARLSGAAGPEVAGLLQKTTADLAQADERLDALYAGTIPKAAYLSQLPAQHQVFSRVTEDVGRLHHELMAEATRRRAEIGDHVRLASLLALAGVAFGILASISVVRLSNSQRAATRREKEARLATQLAHADAEQRQQELERMTTAWKHLVRGFSHDLKNPLNAAEGYLFMLGKERMGPLTGEQARAVANARHCLHDAVALARDLIELVRAEASDLDVKRVQTNLCQTVAAVVDEYRGRAAAKGLTIVTELPSVPARIRSDPARVSQILGNLLSNAINYTDRGGITVRVGHCTGVDGQRWATVAVEDTGAGISRDNQQRIFWEFERLETSRDTGGAGIGLAISERVAHLLGGRISLSSELGHGATFTLWLPAEHSAPP